MKVLRYVEIIYEEADEEMRRLVQGALGCGMSDPSLTCSGFTVGDIRYRCYPTRKAFESPRLREVCRLMDSAKGADIPEEKPAKKGERL